LNALGCQLTATPLNDDVGSSAGDYSLDLRLLGLGHSELVKVEKGFPLCRCYHEMLVRLLHGAARVLLRPAGGPADHFRDEILEAWRGNAMVGLVYFRVRIQTWFDHDPVDEIIHYSGDAVDTAEAVLKASLHSHWTLLLQLLRRLSHSIAAGFCDEMGVQRSRCTAAILRCEGRLGVKRGPPDASTACPLLRKLRKSAGTSNALAWVPCSASSSSKSPGPSISK